MSSANGSNALLKIALAFLLGVLLSGFGSAFGTRYFMQNDLQNYATKDRAREIAIEEDAKLERFIRSEFDRIGDKIDAIAWSQQNR